MPLKKYNITYFALIRCYDNGKLFFLCTDKDATYYHFLHERKVAPDVPENMLGNKFYCLASPERADEKFNQTYYEYIKLFDISHPLYVFERYINYVEISVYAGSFATPGLINFYLNNLEFLENFKSFFKDKADHLIKKANKNYISLPEHMRLNFTGLSPNDESTKNINLLKDQANTINDLLQLHFNTKLTTRELQALKYLLRGRTAAETALLLQISQDY